MFGGLCIAAIYCYLCLPRIEKEKPAITFTLFPVLHDSMIIIPLGPNKALHLHHWLLFSLLFLFRMSEFQKGFSLGMVLQGLLYKDRFDFIVENPYTKSLRESMETEEDSDTDPGSGPTALLESLNPKEVSGARLGESLKES